MSWNAFAVSNLLIILSYFPLFILLLKKSSAGTSKVYALHILAVLIWGFGAFFASTTNSTQIADVFLRVGFIGATLIPVFFLHAVYLLCKTKYDFLFYLSYFQALYFTIFTITGHIETNPRMVADIFYYYSPSINYLVSFVFWLIIASIAHIKLIFFYINEYPSDRKTVNILLLSIIGFIGGTTNFLRTFDLVNSPYGNFLVPVHSFFVTYAILKHNFLNIEVIIKKSLVYTILIAIMSTIYFLAVFALEKLTQSMFAYNSFFVSTLFFFLFGFVCFPLRSKIQQMVDKIFFKGTTAELAQQNELLLKEVAETEKFKAISTLASGIAHEIRNPLTAIKTFYEKFPDKKDDPEFLKNLTNITGKEITRIEDLVKQLLDFAKPSTPKLEETNMNLLLHETVMLANGKLDKNKIEVIYNLEARRSSNLNADANQLKQALLNLILNAVDAMPNGGTLTIGTRVRGGGNRKNQPLNPKPHILETTISDTGCGIPKDDLPHIFDPFYSKKESGTGLGLAITKGIIEEHGGKIGIESCVNSGTKFSINLRQTL